MVLPAAALSECSSGWTGFRAIRAVQETLFDVIAIATGEDSTYHVLARTPFDEYPEQGRRELEASATRRR